MSEGYEVYWHLLSSYYMAGTMYLALYIGEHNQYNPVMQGYSSLKELKLSNLFFASSK